MKKKTMRVPKDAPINGPINQHKLMAMGKKIPQQTSKKKK